MKTAIETAIDRIKAEVERQGSFADACSEAGDREGAKAAMSRQTAFLMSLAILSDAFALEGQQIADAFNAGRERLEHPDFDFVYYDFDDYAKKRGSDKSQIINNDSPDFN